MQLFSLVLSQNTRQAPNAQRCAGGLSKFNSESLSAFVVLEVVHLVIPRIFVVVFQNETKISIAHSIASRNGSIILYVFMVVFTLYCVIVEVLKKTCAILAAIIVRRHHCTLLVTHQLKQANRARIRKGNVE